MADSYFYNLKGEPVILPSEMAAKAKSAGFKERDPSQADLESSVAAESPGSAAFASAMTTIPVLGQKALENIGSSTPEEMHRYQQNLARENPKAHVAGKVVGYGALGAAGAPALAPLRAIGAAGRVGAAVLESGGMGLNEAVNESIIEDKELTAQLVASHVAPAMLGGALVAGGGEVIAAGAKGVVSGATALAGKLPSAARAVVGAADKVKEASPQWLLSGPAQMMMAGFGGPKMAAGIATVKGAYSAAKKVASVPESAAENLTIGLKNLINSRLDAGAAYLGPFQPALEAAAVQGGEDMATTHANLLKSPMAAQYASQMGFSPPSAGSLAVADSRLAAITKIKQIAQQQSAQIEAAADGLFSGKASGAAPLKNLTPSEFREQVANIDAVIRDPEAVYRRFHPEDSAAAPVTLGTATSTLLFAAQYMRDHTPKNPYEGLPSSVAQRWEPSASDLDRWSRIKEAVEAPAKVLQNLARGIISPDQVEAMKAVYPAMYEDLRLKISERLIQASKPLTYQQRLGVMAIVGPQALGMSAQQAQILQQSFAPSQPQQQGGMKGPDGRQKVDQERNLETQSQRLERR